MNIKRLINKHISLKCQMEIVWWSSMLLAMIAWALALTAFIWFVDAFLRGQGIESGFDYSAVNYIASFILLRACLFFIVKE